LVGIQRDAAEALDFGTGVFALVLFVISLYAWSRRRQPALLVVSLAFFLFFFRHLIEMLGDMGEIYEPSGSLQLALILMDFVTLALFFVAVVVRPRRRS
jgi:lipopolysaccharide export LptBFGC system permease protein LptF